MRRWVIEATIRYIKQSYELEDVRVLGYRSLQNLMPLVMACAYFAAVVLDTQAKLKLDSKPHMKYSSKRQPC